MADFDTTRIIWTIVALVAIHLALIGAILAVQSLLRRTFDTWMRDMDAFLNAHVAHPSQATTITVYISARDCHVEGPTLTQGPRTDQINTEINTLLLRAMAAAHLPAALRRLMPWYTQGICIDIPPVSAHARLRAHKIHAARPCAFLPTQCLALDGTCTR